VRPGERENDSDDDSVMTAKAGVTTASAFVAFRPSSRLRRRGILGFVRRKSRRRSSLSRRLSLIFLIRFFPDAVDRLFLMPVDLSVHARRIGRCFMA
jgi:hypothetical protein